MPTSSPLLKHYSRPQTENNPAERVSSSKRPTSVATDPQVSSYHRQTQEPNDGIVQSDDDGRGQPDNEGQEQPDYDGQGQSDDGGQGQSDLKDNGQSNAVINNDNDKQVDDGTLSYYVRPPQIKTVVLPLTGTILYLLLIY